MASKHVACGFLLLLAACEPLRNAQSDFARLTSASFISPTSPATRPAYAASARGDARTDKSAMGPATSAVEAPTELAAVTRTQPVPLTGKSEGELRALLGPPTNEVETPPGKTWRYRDGRCAVDVQLYRDVSTRKFGTLSYEVTSDDNSDEGRRNCLAQLQSRAQANR